MPGPLAGILRMISGGAAGTEAGPGVVEVGASLTGVGMSWTGIGPRSPSGTSVMFEGGMRTAGGNG